MHLGQQCKQGEEGKHRTQSGAPSIWAKCALTTSHPRVDAQAKAGKPSRGREALHSKVTAVGFEPTPLRTGAWSQRLRPLGQTVILSFYIADVIGAALETAFPLTNFFLHSSFSFVLASIFVFVLLLLYIYISLFMFLL